jgi:hypothetical protein
MANNLRSKREHVKLCPAATWMILEISVLSIRCVYLTPAPTRIIRKHLPVRHQDPITCPLAQELATWPPAHQAKLATAACSLSKT